eukprot:1568376-Rhodomonas_salina.1
MCIRDRSLVLVPEYQVVGMHALRCTRHSRKKAMVQTVPAPVVTGSLTATRHYIPTGSVVLISWVQAKVGTSYELGQLGMCGSRLLHRPYSSRPPWLVVARKKKSSASCIDLLNWCTVRRARVALRGCFRVRDSRAPPQLSLEL